jgi:two-component system sensor histidine kinase TctE
MRSSVRLALLKALALPILAILAGGAWVAYRTAVEVANGVYDQSLQNSALALANRVRVVRGQVTLALPAEAEQMLRTDEFDRVYFRVRDRRGKVVAGDEDLPLPETDEPQQHPVFLDAVHEGRRIRAVRLRAGTPPNTFFVTVAETTRKRQLSVNRLLVVLVVPAVLIVLATAAIIWFGISRGLRPLKRLESELERRGGEDLSPVDEAAAPREVELLVRALNGLLGRLRQAAATQRSFLENAAHQLRTPLANLRMQVELLAREPGSQQATARLGESISRTIRLANQLLALARAESGHPLAPQFRPVDLAAIIDDLVDEWVKAADQKAIDLGFDRREAWMLGDPFMLRELIANLLDNAICYTQAGGHVTVRCGARGGQVFLEVEDNGPGIPAAERERALDRFYRVPGSAGSGSGLGLAIANDIAKAHGGALHLGEPQGRSGTLARVEFKKTAQRPPPPLPPAREPPAAVVH